MGGGTKFQACRRICPQNNLSHHPMAQPLLPLWREGCILPHSSASSLQQQPHPFPERRNSLSPGIRFLSIWLTRAVTVPMAVWMGEVRRELKLRLLLPSQQTPELFPGHNEDVRGWMLDCIFSCSPDCSALQTVPCCAVNLPCSLQGRFIERESTNLI